MNEQEKTALAPRTRTLKEILNAEDFRAAVKAALPTHLKPERFIRVAITALTRVPKLQLCTPESFLKCLIDLSAMGLEPDGRRAHLIPFENYKKKTVECTLIVDYKGIVELVRRSGEVSYIHCDEVFTDDEFDYAYGSGAFLKHRPNLEGDRKNRKAFYSFVKMKDGSEDFMVWGPSQVEAIRKRSKSKDDGPWVTDYGEMGKKSVFRNHSKWLPLSPELRERLEMDDESVAIDTSFELAEPTSFDKQEQAHVVITKLIALGKIEEAKAEARNRGISFAPYEEELRKRTASTQEHHADQSNGEGEKPAAGAQPEAASSESETSDQTTTSSPSPEQLQAEQMKSLRLKDLRALLNKVGVDVFGKLLIKYRFDNLDDAAELPGDRYDELTADLNDAIAAAPKQASPKVEEIKKSQKQRDFDLK